MMAVIMPPSNPLALAREPAIVNMPNAALVLVMLHAPVRPSSGVGPGVAAATPAPAPLAASVRAVTSSVLRAILRTCRVVWVGGPRREGGDSARGVGARAGGGPCGGGVRRGGRRVGVF